jgi:hypothetical protein
LVLLGGQMEGMGSLLVCLDECEKEWISDH